VVVPNTDLLHNHQTELAEVLAEQEYVIHGKIEYVALASLSPWPLIGASPGSYYDSFMLSLISC